MDEKLRTQDVSDVDNPEVGHETRDINARIVVAFGASLAVAAILIHLIVWLLFDAFGGLNARGFPREYPLVQTSEIRLPPAPRLQDKPREDLKALRRHEDDLLNSYTWINQATGAVRIPIAEAMKRVVEQGFPVENQGQQETGLPEYSSSGRVLEPSIKR